MNAPRSGEQWSTSAGEIVRYERTESAALSTGDMATYEIWCAPSVEAAKEYLNTRTVVEGLYYLVVESPQGRWGKDRMGVYKE